jgi:hypothetical protein
MNMKQLQFISLGIILSVIVLSCKKQNDVSSEQPVVSQVIAATGDITSKVTAFRDTLGNPNNGAVGLSQASGRREINWDGVVASVTNNDTFPGNFFNVKSTRGLVLQNSTGKFRVSDKDFEDVHAGYSQIINPFSQVKTFSSVGTTGTTVVFRVPGKDSAAYVHGFGVVFCDVENANATTLEFFQGEKSLGFFKAPVRSSPTGLSFLGVNFPYNKITSVKIIAGNAVLGSNNDTEHDVVVLDDFIYSEPQKVQ